MSQNPNPQIRHEVATPMSLGADLILEDDAPISSDEEELTGPQRRCIVTGEVMAKEQLLRFAVSPDGIVVPDIAEKLPGRGLWIKADRATLEAATAKNPFARVARRQVKVPADLKDQVVSLTRQRLIDAVGFARRAGSAVAGFEKVEAWARAKKLQVLLLATDAGKDGRGKLEALSPNAHIIDVLDSEALAGIFGTIGIVVYAGISDKAHAARLILLAGKLEALLPPVHTGTE